MKYLAVSSVFFVLAVVTEGFAACDSADFNYTKCLYNENLRAAGQNPGGGYDYSRGVSSRPNPAGGYDYSNGISSRRNPVGGYDYSNGATCRPNPLGGMACR